MKVCGGDDGIGRSDSVTAKVVAAVNKSLRQFEVPMCVCFSPSRVHGPRSVSLRRQHDDRVPLLRWFLRSVFPHDSPHSFSPVL